MGRFVSGDFDWRFAFGDQDSRFGEILENIFIECESVQVVRYISDMSGEIVRFYLDDYKEFNEALVVYLMECNIKGIVPEEGREGEDYWNYLMMRKFKKKITEEGLYEFEVEY